MKFYTLFTKLFFIALFYSGNILGSDTISMGILLDEMISMERLVNLPSERYRAIQFASYDRSSTSAYEEGWFANSDGFGREPEPNFEQVLLEPGQDGVGEYLICDVQQPGAIVRLWTAAITGRVRVYLDDMDCPFFEGNAEDFFWTLPEILLGEDNTQGVFRQFDAVYFPLPFSERCRIEWIGNINEVHFYHVGMKVYNSDIFVENFSRSPLSTYSEKLDKVVKIMKGSESAFKNTVEQEMNVIDPTMTKVLWETEGQGAIDHFSLSVSTSDIEEALRKSILNIYFDGSSTPQVQAPIGDFFGAAPGLNPFNSLAVYVDSTGLMVSLFIMPYRQNVRIEVVNHSSEMISLSTGVRTREFIWEEGRTMHFRARWRMDHDVTASDKDISDYPYLMAMGQGRLVGAATYIYNPSNVPTSWGNWWGEGDEKIFIDEDEFPSFFGTGSEDYYNYSWSSAKIFSYPYCGQPRNDGPGNRGYVANFRWHIMDDIPFEKNIAFYMELLHHGVVPRTSYGRIVYYYSLPGTIDDFRQISVDDIRDLPYYTWSPEAFKGSKGNRFVSAHEVVEQSPAIRIDEGRLWAEGRIVMWEPAKQGEQIRFILNSDREADQTRLGLTMANMPEGGIISLYINGDPVKIGGQEETSLRSEYHTVLDNYNTDLIKLNKGENIVVIESRDRERGKKVGIDFFWIREE